MAVVVRCCAQEPKTQMAGARACLDPAAEIGQAPGEGSDVQGLSNSRPTFVGERRVPALDQLGPLLILPCMATAAHANPAQRPLALNLGSLVMDAKGSAKLWRQRGTRSPEHHHIARGGAELNTTPLSAMRAEASEVLRAWWKFHLARHYSQLHCSRPPACPRHGTTIPLVASIILSSIRPPVKEWSRAMRRETTGCRGAAKQIDFGDAHGLTTVHPG